MPFPYYKQLDAMGCSPTCLRMIARHYGRSYSLQNLRERCHIIREGGYARDKRCGGECRMRLRIWQECARQQMCRTSRNGSRGFRLGTTPRSEQTSTGSAQCVMPTTSSCCTTAGLRRKEPTSSLRQEEKSTMNWSGTSSNLETDRRNHYATQQRHKLSQRTRSRILWARSRRQYFGA